LNYRSFNFILKYSKFLEFLLFSDNFYQNSFLSLPVKFSIKYLFPWSKIQVSACNRNDNFSSHHCSS